jgi:hypothetical protein
MVIARRLTFLVSLCLVPSLALGQGPSVADRTLAAEGDTVNQARHFTLGHWRLWRLHGGEYEVAESQAGGNPVVQTFRFDRHFLPTGFSLRVDRMPNNPSSHPFSISCDYTPKDLHCDTDFDGHKSTASVAAKQPYVFIPGEYYALDFCWFLTGIVRLATSGNGNQPVNLYGMIDRPGRVGEIDLEPDSKPDSMRLTITGEVTADALGKSQKLKRYGWGGPSRLLELRATSKGIVVSAGENPAEALILSGYKEYESWGPEQ